ncbi:Autophagy-related protein 8i [Ranunculus cassubicifolius]
MRNTKSFKDEYSFDERSEESKRILAKYPDRIPLVPRDMSIGHFIHILSLRLDLSSGKALFAFVNNTLPQTASLMDSLYGSFKDEDVFLYMCYSSEKTFG